MFFVSKATFIDVTILDKIRCNIAIGIFLKAGYIIGRVFTGHITVPNLPSSYPYPTPYTYLIACLSLSLRYSADQLIDIDWPSDKVLGALSWYSRLSLSRIPRDPLKYFEISVPRHTRFAELRKKIVRTTTFNKYICNWTLEVEDVLKILWKRGEIGAISPLFHNIFYLLLDFHV